jgi:hypothetical protein
VSVDDDQAWLEGLAGRDGDSPAAREATELRRALQRRAVSEADVPQVSPHREAALLARARREGVVTQAPTQRSWRIGAWFARVPAPLAMATVAGFAIVIGMLLTLPESDETVRGRDPATKVLESTDPEALRFALVDALLDAGADPTGYTRLDEQVVEAVLPVPVPTQIRQVLTRFEVPVPDNGELLVRIRTKPP